MSSATNPNIDPPPNAVFPPPLSSHPSRSSSSNKRRRIDVSSIASSSTASSGAAFSTSTNAAIVGHIPKCWLCEAKTVQVCHIVAKGDHSFARLRDEEGLITFTALGDIDNGIALCPLCHVNFDDISAPGFVFFPADLQYFINFERSDYMRREAGAARGTRLKRVCPNAIDYKQHQVDSGEADEDTIGGLYQRYILKDYMSPLLWSQSDGPQEYQFSNKPWHGAPMAALRRAFQIHGDPLSRAIPAFQRARLRELQDLYMRDPPSPVPISHRPNDEELQVLEHTTGLEESNSQSLPEINPTVMAIPGTTTAVVRTVDSGIDTRTIERHHNHRKRRGDAYIGVEFPENRVKQRMSVRRPTTSIAQWGEESSSDDKVLWLSKMRGWQPECAKPL
ncbi:hypothetical protein E6O75_ATG04629 [Venturia nashicola]|uniref:HNH nuclease domain-containing protein n=1 Tax=Venturia nashicola TaxID=86259 RepID=A0A4Z1P3W2_9PEZI|nr:hypothetical protein E6O75_ATG04629 [Venturia nashicola]